MVAQSAKIAHSGHTDYLTLSAFSFQVNLQTIPDFMLKILAPNNLRDPLLWIVFASN